MDVNLKKAIDDRRLHHQLIPTYAEIEEDFPIVNFTNLKKKCYNNNFISFFFVRLKSAANYLRKVGHYTQCFSFGGSTVQGIRVLDDRIDAYSDPRKGTQI